MFKPNFDSPKLSTKIIRLRLGTRFLRAINKQKPFFHLSPIKKVFMMSVWTFIFKKYKNRMCEINKKNSRFS